MPSRRSILVALTVAALVGAAASCGGGTPVTRVTSPFTASDASVFDQGVDFVDDPDILDGHWAEDWQREFQHRIGSSDLIEVVRIISLRTATLPDQEPKYTIDIEPTRALLGEATHVDLVSSSSDSGYSGIDSNERRLAYGTFLLFVKYTTGANGAIVAKWHLSPATNKVIAHADELVNARLHPRPQDQGTTVERTSTN